MGLATDLWWAEAQLYREDFDIRFQIEYSLISTQKMFSDPSKCHYTDEDVVKDGKAWGG